MRVVSKVALAGVLVLALGASGAAFAQSTSKTGKTPKRGGYSVTTSDTINTYGNSRTKWGGADFYRDPRLDAQTQSGPFDHGFFFDSGVNPRGGNSPYRN